MISINNNSNELFIDYNLSKEDLLIKEDLIANELINKDDIDYFINNIYDKNIINLFTEQKLKFIILKKRLNNLNAINTIYKINDYGSDDKKICFEDYKNFYHIIFNFDINEINKIKDILNKKFNIKNVNLYKFDDKHLIYIFDFNSNFYEKTNNKYFINLRNRINHYNKQKLLDNQIYVSSSYLNYLFIDDGNKWQCDCKLIKLKYFSNIFDDNWYKFFQESLKLFLINLN